MISKSLATFLALFPLLSLASCDMLKEKASPALPCPAKYNDLTAAQKTGAFECACGSNVGGSVWGSTVYTTDSAICGAALHAGAMPATGGKVKLMPAPGCANYTGSQSGGIQTAGWGRYETSFYFDGHGDGTCAAPVAGGGSNICPQRFGDGKVAITCDCPGAATQVGSIWGTDIYTTDSSVCRAALHAGAITTAGGRITAIPAPGCGRYKGTMRNGTQTGDWAAYGASFYIGGKGNGQCQ